MSQNWTTYFNNQLDDIIAELERYVKIESPTHNKAAVDQMGQYIKEQFLALGCKVETIPQPKYGDQFRVEYGPGEEQILILGHFDTVKDIGTIENEPWRIEDGKIYGPGVYDMKSGIVHAYFALKAIIDQKIPLNKKLVFYWNTDEEVGSPSSKEHMIAEAKKSSLALVLEPAAKNGQLKTSRKGGGTITLRAKGRAAHAGADHALGVNAIEELAHQIIKIQSWTDYDLGTTFSVGTIKGGTVTNVIPESAEIKIDVRISKASEAERVNRLFEQLTPVNPLAKLEVDGSIESMPLERTAKTEQLFLKAKEAARLENYEIDEIGVGGMSDGNIIAPVGITVLDGLGAMGDGAHAIDEHIDIEEIPFRIALLFRLLTSL